MKLGLRAGIKIFCLVLMVKYKIGICRMPSSQTLMIRKLSELLCNHHLPVLFTLLAQETALRRPKENILTGRDNHFPSSKLPNMLYMFSL